MAKAALNKPVLICLYGFPGSGKSYLARNLKNHLNIAHVSADRIRGELFQEPRYSVQENSIVHHLMNYMTSEFLANGLSVIYDTNAIRANQRRTIRELAKKHKAEYMLIWLQIDPDSSFARTQKRDKRTLDDRYAQDHSKESFDLFINRMQNPRDEQYMVISGKHSFNTQKNTVINKLYQLGHLKSEDIQQNITRPDLVNLVPSAPPVYTDRPRHNISISNGL